MKNKRKIIYFLILLGAISGACMFFPVQLEGGSTCLFQYVFKLEHDMDDNHAFSNDLIHNIHEHTAGAGLDIYLRHYAFVWWFSLALTVLSYFGLRKQIRT